MTNRPGPATTPGQEPAAGRWISSFVRNGGLLMGGNAIQSVVGLAAQLVVMRLLRPEDFGEFSLALAAAGLVQLIFSPRLGVVVMRAGEAEMTDSFRRLLYCAMTAEAVVCLALMTIWLAAVGYDTVWPYLLALTLVVGHWFTSVTMFFERGLAYGRIAGIETASQLTGHVLSVVLALAGAGIASLYLREAAAVVVRGVWMARSGAVPFWRPRMPSLAEWRSLLKDVRVVWLDGILDGGFQRLTVLAAGALGGTHAAGLFSQAQRLALVPHQILAPVVVRLSGNIFARIEDHYGRRQLLVRVLGLVALPLAVAAIGAWAFAEPLVPWLFGPDWAEAGKTLAAMTGMILGFSLFELCRSYCLSIRLNRLWVAARLLQYGVFGAGMVLAAGGGAMELGLVMSAVYGITSAMLVISLLAKHPVSEKQ